jgi:hypothetical protein
VGVVQEPVTDGIGERGVADVVVVLGGGQLAGDDRRRGAIAILEDLEEIVALLTMGSAVDASRVREDRPLP